VAWSPDTREHIEAMFASLSVFDRWSTMELFHLTQTGDEHDASERERKRRANAERAESTAAAMWRMKCDGMSMRAIAEATGKSLGSVHLTIKRLESGAAVRPHGGSKRRAA
jgi:DNA-directed RNA polymerase specialized sigma24 family protein